MLLSVYFIVKQRIAVSELSALKAVRSHESLLVLCMQQPVTGDSSAASWGQSSKPQNHGFWRH